jgi:hypothetical protein
MTVRHLRVGPSDLTAVLTHATGRAGATLTATAPVTVDFVQALPAGARDARATLDGKPVDARLERGVHDAALTVPVHVGPAPQKVAVSWTGGLEVEPPRPALTPGQESSGLRVLDFRATDAGWTLAVEGTTGRRYEIRLVGEPLSRVEGAEVSRREGDVTTLVVSFPAGPARQAKTVSMVR